MEQDEKWTETCFPMQEISWHWFIKLLACILIRPFSSSHLSRCTIEHSKCYIHPSCKREVVCKMSWPFTLTSETLYCIFHLSSLSPTATACLPFICSLFPCILDNLEVFVMQLTVREKPWKMTRMHQSNLFSSDTDTSTQGIASTSCIVYCIICMPYCMDFMGVTFM